MACGSAGVMPTSALQFWPEAEAAPCATGMAGGAGVEALAFAVAALLAGAAAAAFGEAARFSPLAAMAPLLASKVTREHSRTKSARAAQIQFRITKCYAANRRS